MKNNVITQIFNSELFYLLKEIFLISYYSVLNFYFKIVFFIGACCVFLNLDKKNINLGLFNILYNNFFLKFKRFNCYILSKHKLHAVVFFIKNNTMKCKGLSEYGRKYFYLYNILYTTQSAKHLFFIGFSNNTSIIYYWNFLWEADFVRCFLYIKSKMSVV